MIYVKEIDAYLNKILGLKFESRGRIEESLAPLPDEAGEMFECGLCAIEDTEYVLLVQRRPEDRTARLLDGITLTEKALGLPCILITETMDNMQRRSFIQHRVSFIVPLRQIYIPLLGTYFTENKLHAFKEVELLTPAAQYLLLYHLQKKAFDRMSLGDIARETDYSAKTVTIVAAELRRAGLCDIVPTGVRTKEIVFNGSGRELWDLAWPMLGSPILKVGYIPEDSLDGGLLPKSGDDALARYVRKSVREKKVSPAEAAAAGPGDRTRTTYAVRKKDRIGFDLETNCTATEYPDSVRVEFWKYDPCRMASRGYVDPLSLALCYKGDTVGQMQKRIDLLIGNVL